MSLLLATPAIFHKALGGGSAVSITPVAELSWAAPTSAGTSYTWASNTLGSSANGNLFIGIGVQGTDISSMTADGNSLTQVAVINEFGEAAYIFYDAAGATTASTGNVVANFPASATPGRIMGYIWRIDGYDDTGTWPLDSATASGNGTIATDVTTVADGGVIAFGWTYSTLTWAGLTDGTVVTDGTDEARPASALTTTAETRSVDYVGGDYGRGVCISMGPA